MRLSVAAGEDACAHQVAWSRQSGQCSTSDGGAERRVTVFCLGVGAALGVQEVPPALLDELLRIFVDAGQNGFPAAGEPLARSAAAPQAGSTPFGSVLKTTSATATSHLRMLVRAFTAVCSAAKCACCGIADQEEVRPPRNDKKVSAHLPAQAVWWAATPVEVHLVLVELDVHAGEPLPHAVRAGGRDGVDSQHVLRQVLRAGAPPPR